MSSLLITNADCVNEGRRFEADILVREGRIDAIGSNLQSHEADQVFDAKGRLLIPGMIDDQVHFREPGLTHKADFTSESRAAVAGGITSFMEMPNSKPPTLSLEALEAKHARAAEVSRANYSFYLGASNDNLEAIRSVQVAQSCGVKIFMGASTGNMLVDDEATLDAIFRDSPLLIATHCEDTPMILAKEAEYRERYGEEVPIEAHPLIRSEAACYKSSSLAIELAQRHDARLHVLHLTTAKELAQFSPGPIAGKRITAEACVHHLYFDERDYAEKGALIKCNPAIKRPEDREALLRALAEDRIDVVATDHAPHTLDEKGQSYFNAPAGLPLVQDALPSLLEHVHAGRLTLEQAVAKTSHAVAECYGVEERGYLREGYWADLALIDLDAPYQVEREQVLAKCGWSPFEGRRFRSRVIMTLVNGEVAFELREQGGQVNDQLRGQRLRFRGVR
ncbi:dihydroorotase [Lamprobacter modestohalophilus]|uniref:Dihydroorotase n=1 Tax=Lamprobacter modestohalophilus TaxID=1064514 RepID=A0A9X0W9Z7_9GAMM|nr:dihydroorotase [Lamprobacter modestohalophilus]MBK1619023.1 dihydroorotase [Lamprobacter modestohalophilus]